MQKQDEQVSDIELAEALAAAQRANLVARAALIIACVSIAIAILGMFLPI